MDKDSSRMKLVLFFSEILQEIKNKSLLYMDEILRISQCKREGQTADVTHGCCNGEVSKAKQLEPLGF